MQKKVAIIKAFRIKKETKKRGEGGGKEGKENILCIFRKMQANLFTLQLGHCFLVHFVLSSTENKPCITLSYVLKIKTRFLLNIRKLGS